MIDDHVVYLEVKSFPTSLFIYLFILNRMPALFSIIMISSRKQMAVMRLALYLLITGFVVQAKSSSLP